ncbi:hypothetical protein LEM8419_02341 [Neolewinella maritima]|uniref:RHS repeat-associated core domain-containing protein n=1 Tax=Neolewinella maritima TaxID=1383882 RepID=A0ABN8FAD5_9BACT|nr:RHS repeat-associated core domain-containing protein [Neolewinella maritima]CAH1001438.1 hypothetical protein LEM8419_02341 [Neolewinella maritima]
MKDGNISQISWQIRGRTAQAYRFDYDLFGRLSSARSAQRTSNGGWNWMKDYDTDYSYDVRGNMLTLKRNGKSSCSAETDIDDLAYTYSTGSNRLTKVQEKNTTNTARAGFAATSDYTYDANGNLRTDSQKGLTITSNYLNLPSRINRSGGRSSITNTYTATGRKLETTGGGDAREYFDGIEYVSGVLNSVYFEHGRVYFANGNASSGRYEYTLRDHLGSSRVSFSDLNGDGNITATTNRLTSELLDEQHYYPFGMAMQGPWVEHSGREDLHRYNGKELNEELGLFDYGARWYDPTIARWNAVDPLADSYASITPYAYVGNSPIKFIDPDGMRVDVYQLITGEDGKVSEEGLNSLYHIMTDLESITGLSVGVEAGLLTYGEGTGGGSSTAASYLKNIIDSKSTITVGPNTDPYQTGSISPNVNRNKDPNHINFDGATAYAFESMFSTSKSGSDDYLTMGAGMLFLHETLHTDTGLGVLGHNYDNFKDGDAWSPGGTVSYMNEIRSELGIPTRNTYKPQPRLDGEQKWNFTSTKGGNIKVGYNTFMSWRNQYFIQGWNNVWKGK